MNRTRPNRSPRSLACLLGLLALVIQGCPEETSAGPDTASNPAADVNQDTTAADSAGDADTAPDLPAPCTLEGLPDTAEIALGGRLVMSLEASDALDSLKVTAPAGFDVRLDAPSARLFVFAPYDAPRNALDLVINAPCGATATTALTVREPRWESLPTWTADQDGPLGREYFNLWIDAQDPDRLLLFGGFNYVPQQFTTATDLWTFDLNGPGGWSQLNHSGAPELAGGRIALVPGTQTGIHYGGLTFQNQQASLPFSLSLLDYGASPPTWTPLNPGGAPNSGTYQPAFFYDAPRDRFLAIGGQGVAGTHMDVAVFNRDANTWLPQGVTGDTRPSGRTGFFWVHDTETERFIVFSGEQGGGPGNGCNCAEDTWALELAESPPRWVQLLGAQSPPLGRRNGAFALDPVGHRMVMWGGTADGTTAAPGVWALTLERGREGWNALDVPNDGKAPTVRASGGMVYDAARERLLMGFGNDGIVGAYEDLWSLRL